MRELDPLVSAAPVLQAGPAHIATLKTFDPPLRELEGRLRGCGPARQVAPLPDRRQSAPAAGPPDERRPDPAPRPGRQGAEDARVPAPLRERRRARADRGRVEEAGRSLARVARADRGRARPPRPGGARARRSRSCAGSWPRTTGGCTRFCATSVRSPGSDGHMRTRSSIGPSSRRSRSPASSTRTRPSASRRDPGGPQPGARAAARRARATRMSTSSTGGSASRARAAATRCARSTTRSTRSSTVRPARRAAGC